VVEEVEDLPVEEGLEEVGEDDHPAAEVVDEEDLVGGAVVEEVVMVAVGVGAAVAAEVAGEVVVEEAA